MSYLDPEMKFWVELLQMGAGFKTANATPSREDMKKQLYFAAHRTAMSYVKHYKIAFSHTEAEKLAPLFLPYTCSYAEEVLAAWDQGQSESRPDNKHLYSKIGGALPTVFLIYSGGFFYNFILVLLLFSCFLLIF